MIIEFSKTCPVEIIDRLEKSLKGWKLAKFIKFDVNNRNLDIIISKLGTSKIRFNVHSCDSSTTFTQTSEKIALSHKSIETAVRDKLISSIEKLDGNVSAVQNLAS